MKKSIFKVVLMLLTIVIVMNAFSSCNGSDAQEDSTQQDGPTQQELDQMYEKAKNCEDNAKFTDAIKIYRELAKYNYNDPDFGNDALAIRETRYTNQKIACKYFSYTVDSLKSKLKDPNSLVVYSMRIDSNSPKGQITIIFDYGAKNGFGGMVRDTYTYTYALANYDMETIHEANKEHMDSVDCGKDDVGKYLAGNYHIYKESQFNAIVAGTHN